MTTAFIASLWTARVTPKGKPYPTSVWDDIKPAPFYWATPAPNINGSYPEPWRCAHTDTALELFGADPLKFYAIRKDDDRSRITIRSRDKRRWSVLDLFDVLPPRLAFPAHVSEDCIVIDDDIRARPFDNDSASL